MCHFLASVYLVDPEVSPVAAAEEVVSIEMTAGDLNCGSIGGFDIGSQASICGNYGRLHEVCLAVSKSISSSVAAISSLAFSKVDEMNRDPIMEVRMVALESILSCSMTQVGELE